MPEILYPIIPETITVHLGVPGSNAKNVTVPFADSEISLVFPHPMLRIEIRISNKIVNILFINTSREFVLN